MKITGNEPANPISYKQEYGDYGKQELIKYHGLTIRQQFAMAAMQGLLASKVTKDWGALTLVTISVKHADALIAELNRTEVA